MQKLSSYERAICTGNDLAIKDYTCDRGTNVALRYICPRNNKRSFSHAREWILQLKFAINVIFFHEKRDRYSRTKIEKDSSKLNGTKREIE